MIEDKTKESELLPFGKREYPFYRKGMCLDEWKAELKYMNEHLDDVREGRYMPMWKQE